MRLLSNKFRAKKDCQKKPKKKWLTYLIVASVALLIWMLIHLYYYNALVELESDVKTNWAHVEAQLQRRNHIQQNLTRIVTAYSKYERETLTSLIEMRTGAIGDGEAKPAKPTKPAEANQQYSCSPVKLTDPGIAKMLPDIRLIAEQYPELKLAQNLQQVSASIIDTEKQIADQIIAYNKAVNSYTTVLEQFPSNIVGATFGFKKYELYQPDKELLKFTPVQY